MLQRTYRWPAPVLGVMLYMLVFIWAHHVWSVPPQQHGQPELLLFLLPGMAIALMRPVSPILATLWSALPATALGIGWIMLTQKINHPGLLVIAWSLSALFWAGCGALLIRLLRIMLAARVD